mgnify:CR=1 FL=1
MQRSKKNYRRYLLVLSLLVSLIAGICTSAFADSYTYDIRGNQIPAPDAYELERTVYASELGLESMSTVSGVFYRDGKVYVTLKGTIVITDENFENATYITEYTREDNTKSSIKAPTGIWVTEDGHIYICEMDQGEIIEFDEEVEYTIVGSTEVNLAENKISNESPIGKALLGAKKGQTVEVNAPAGVIKYEIKKITK